MQPEDIQDITIAFVLLVAFVIIGNVLLHFFDFPNVLYASDFEFNDEQRLLLLNYLRTDTSFGEVSDLIALNEIRGDLDDVLHRSSRSIFGGIYHLGGLGGRNYLLTVKYPNEEIEVIDATNAWDISQQGNVKTTGGVKYKNKIPSLKGGLIEVELELENE